MSGLPQGSRPPARACLRIFRNISENIGVFRIYSTASAAAVCAVERVGKPKTMVTAKRQGVSIPRGGGVHRFRNGSTADARMLCTVVPAGLDASGVEKGVRSEKRGARRIGPQRAQRRRKDRKGNASPFAPSLCDPCGPILLASHFSLLFLRALRTSVVNLFPVSSHWSFGCDDLRTPNDQSTNDH